MLEVFKVNRILISILGLTSLAIVIRDDVFNLNEMFAGWFEVVSWILLIVVIVIAVFEACLAIYDPNRKICRGDVQINQKMLEIVSQSGNTCILSRNFSWVGGAGIMEELMRKAKAGDLTLILNQEGDATKKLRSAGAKVVVYKGVIPKCRFTIKGYSGNHPTLYIAVNSTPERHVIYRYKNKNDIALRLAEDLVHILEKYA